MDTSERRFEGAQSVYLHKDDTSKKAEYLRNSKHANGLSSRNKEKTALVTQFTVFFFLPWASMGIHRYPSISIVLVTPRRQSSPSLVVSRRHSFSVLVVVVRRRRRPRRRR